MQLNEQQISRLVILMLIICLGFGLACAAPRQMIWVKPGASQNDFSQDKYICMQEAQQSVSAAEVNVYGGQSKSEIITNMALFNSCMNAKGWYLEEQKQQPKAVPLPEGKAPQDNSMVSSRSSRPEDLNNEKPKPEKVVKETIPPTEKQISLKEDKEVTSPSPQTPDNKIKNVKIIASENSIPPSIPSPQYLVVIKSANLRVEANDKSKIILTLKRGEIVEKIGLSGNWLNVKLSTGTAGWVFKDLITISK